MTVIWTRSAAHKLADRSRPPVLELELDFSCLVKKAVRFPDLAPGRTTIRVADPLHLSGPAWPIDTGSGKAATPNGPMASGRPS